MENHGRSAFYVSDLDGTLLKDDATLSPAAREILRELLGEGLPFTVASSRSVVSMQGILGDLPLSLPVIELNGACISDLESGEHLVVRSIDQALADEILRLVREAGHSPLVTAFDGSRDLLYAETPRNAGMEWYVTDRMRSGDKRLQLVKDVGRSLRDQLLCFSIIGQAESVDDLRRSIEGRLGHKVAMNFFENRYSPGWHWLTINDARATKDQALRRLLRQCGREGVELTVFGDGQQDIAMFSVADHAIAVANADGDVKQYASKIIGTNMEDSVPLFLQAEWSARS